MRRTSARMKLDALVQQALEPWEREVDLLRTIPGIGRTSPHAILAKVGPEPTNSVPGCCQSCGLGRRLTGLQRECGQASLRSCPRGECGPRATLSECALGAARSSSSQSHRHDNMIARIGY